MKSSLVAHSSILTFFKCPPPSLLMVVIDACEAGMSKKMMSNKQNELLSFFFGEGVSVVKIKH